MTTTALDAISRPRAAARLWPSTAQLAHRALRTYLRTPQLLIIGLLQGLTFLLIFRYVFGGAIGTGTLAYVDFMVPGIITVSSLFLGMSTAVAIAHDVQEGFFDRLRSLPMPTPAIPLGRALADTLFLIGQLAVLCAVSFALGFRIHTSWPQALAAFGLCVLFGFAFVWLFITLGLLTRNAQAAQGVGFLVLPLSFASSAYVPVDTMPGWLQSFADHQPVTDVTNAVRTLTQGAPAEALLGHSAAYFTTHALLWTAALLALSAPVAVWRARR